jgi:fatty acid desaturase
MSGEASEPRRPSVGERLTAWFKKPGPEASPGENLRFVRRIQVATAALVAFLGARQTLFGAWVGPVLLGLAGFGLFTALLLTLAIRSVDRRAARRQVGGADHDD